MPEDEGITGIDQIDRDLAYLLALGDDSSRLEAAKSAIADESASLAKLISALDVSVIRITLALTDPEKAQKLLAQTPESSRPAVEKAIDIIKTDLAGIERHPAILRSMRAALERKSEPRTDLTNRITAVEWKIFWGDDKGKLAPMARTSFLDERGELLLDSTLDWDDVAFVMRSCARILVGLCQKSEPVAKANLLGRSYAQQLSEKIAETQSLLDELASTASTLGIDLSKSAAEQGVDDPSESGDSQ